MPPTERAPSSQGTGRTNSSLGWESSSNLSFLAASRPNANTIPNTVLCGAQPQTNTQTASWPRAGRTQTPSQTRCSVEHNPKPIPRQLLGHEQVERKHHPKHGALWSGQLTADHTQADLLDEISYINMIYRGGTIHRCIDISRYFSRDTYRDIIFYNRDFFFFFWPQWFSFRQKRYIILSTCDFCKVIPQIHSYFVKIFCEISVETN